MFNKNEVVTNYIQRSGYDFASKRSELFFFSPRREQQVRTNTLLLLSSSFSLTKNVLLASFVFPPEKEEGGGGKIPSRWVPLFVVPKLRFFARMTSSFFFPSTQTRINIGLFSGTSAIDPPGLGKASLPRSTARFHLFSPLWNLFFFFSHSNGIPRKIFISRRFRNSKGKIRRDSR